MKATYGNSGYLAVPTRMRERSEVVVTEPITAKESDRDGLQYVGGDHSTFEYGDSITPDEQRSSAHLLGCTDAKKNFIHPWVRGL